MTLSGQNGRELVLPLPYALQAITLPARDAAYKLRKDVERLTLEPIQTKS